MGRRVPVKEIRKAGFPWPPQDDLLRERAIAEGETVDLAAARASLARDRDFHRERLDDAAEFKRRSGMEYDEFTDRFDDDVSAHRALVGALALVDTMLARLDPDALEPPPSPSPPAPPPPPPAPPSPSPPAPPTVVELPKALAAAHARTIIFRRTEHWEYTYVAETPQGAIWILRLGDFPDEPMWELFVDLEPVGSFDNWPPLWDKLDADKVAVMPLVVQLVARGAAPLAEPPACTHLLREVLAERPLELPSVYATRSGLRMKEQGRPLAVPPRLLHDTVRRLLAAGARVTDEILDEARAWDDRELVDLLSGE